MQHNGYEAAPVRIADILGVEVNVRFPPIQSSIKGSFIPQPLCLPPRYECTQGDCLGDSSLIETAQQFTD